MWGLRMSPLSDPVTDMDVRSSESHRALAWFLCDCIDVRVGGYHVLLINPIPYPRLAAIKDQ